MRAVVVGMGLTGACCSLEFARAGFQVVGLDRSAPGEATTSNSGSAVLYQTKESELFFEMTRRSMELWDDLAAKGIAPFRRDGSHVLFSNAEEEAFVARRAGLLSERGVNIRRLDRRELSGLVPALHEAITGSYHCLDDAETNPFMSCRGIITAASAAGAHVQPGTACVEITTAGGAVSGVRTAVGEKIDADIVVLASGSLTVDLAATVGVELPVVPERGEQLLTAPMPPTLKGRLLSARYTRGKAAGAFVGLALGQEPDGRIKIGSTRENGKSELVTSERGRTALIEELALCFPGLAALPIERHTVGLRMTSRTGRPIVTMPEQVPGLVVIDGLGGNGVAFAPLIARIARSIAQRAPDSLARELTLAP